VQVAGYAVQAPSLGLRHDVAGRVPIFLHAGVPSLPVPGQGAHLDCFPWAAQRWGV
jgi:hypothetical protein